MIDIKQIAAQALADFMVAILSAAVIGLFAYVFRERLFNYISDAKLMKRIGVKKLKRVSRFSNKELKHIFYHAKTIKVYYKTGERFWNRLEKNEILSRVLQKNPELRIKVILAHKDSLQSKVIYDSERLCGSRGIKEPTIPEEVDHMRSLFDKYDYIEYKTDPDFFFLPYLIVEYCTKDGKKKEISYLGLNIFPARSPNSLQIVSDRIVKRENEGLSYEDLSMEDTTLIGQLQLHFDTAWQLADKYAATIGNNSNIHSDD